MTNDDMEQLRMAPDVEAILTDLRSMTDSIAGHNQTIVERRHYVRNSIQAPDVRQAIDRLKKALDELDLKFKSAEA